MISYPDLHDHHDLTILPVSHFLGNILNLTTLQPHTQLTRRPNTVEGALRAGPDAHPPNNMHRALIYQGALVCAAVVFVFALRGKQARRELDERFIHEAKHEISLGESTVVPETPMTV